MAIDVVAAVIRRGDRVLIARRLPTCHLGGEWEFPGGKIEPGENPRTALRRELREELSIDCRIGRRIGRIVHRYERGLIRLWVYEVFVTACRVQLQEHDKVAWVPATDFRRYHLTHADLKVLPLLQHLNR
jgi:8-oxo-dGTP diphosphatase